ncbi:MAG: 30S ribosomal protein S20 [Armatimonadota bacterium]|nr:30S ribosomal protein S20 [Armatimonadota bacterium]MDR7451241.1 30S ribosomal protein S20 [Armatimonadota bacterium]MDR7466856.1 30S ribosomal protein S20 [Armatimonadota bacterium]MDR7492671.1 30S ribosomal protein S20 [Armatimonadota bacterium]MDR7499600.1 30S ribosomal protein S20 [Armatimonadota bacterium]
MAKRSRSGLKRMRQAERRRRQNQAVRSRLRTLAKAATTPEALRAAIAALDKAAGAGIIHKNTAARRKSRLIARFRRAAAA